MKASYLILLLFASVSLSAQSTDSTDIKFIEGVIREIQPEGTIYYADNPVKKTINYIVSCAEGRFKELEKSGVKLSKADIKKLKRKLRKQTDVIYPDSLFQNSKRISWDKVTRVVEDENRKLRESILKLPDSTNKWNYFSKERKWAFSFTKPIYLQSGSILVHYFMYYANSSGERALRIYRKENGNWIFLGGICVGEW
ncbi:MAG: hypothetical protein QM726_18785 [Chitinophagaceae bacterium]